MFLSVASRVTSSTSRELTPRATGLPAISTPDDLCAVDQRKAETVSDYRLVVSVVQRDKRVSLREFGGDDPHTSTPTPRRRH